MCYCDHDGTQPGMQCPFCGRLNTNPTHESEEEVSVIHMSYAMRVDERGAQQGKIKEWSDITVQVKDTKDGPQINLSVESFADDVKDKPHSFTCSTLNIESAFELVKALSEAIKVAKDSK